MIIFKILYGMAWSVKRGKEKISQEVFDLKALYNMWQTVYNFCLFSTRNWSIQVLKRHKYAEQFLPRYKSQRGQLPGHGDLWQGETVLALSLCSWALFRNALRSCFITKRVISILGFVGFIMGKRQHEVQFLLILLTMESVAVIGQINVLHSLYIISYLCSMFLVLYFWSQDISFNKSLTLWKKAAFFQIIPPPQAIKI
jgi:hypothetical protein